jgi:adenine/guanine phosphoribosyltransferase-like PRPP-binding protein
MSIADLYNWSLDASTQVAILLFLAVGVVSSSWTLALRPFLETFSKRYTRHVAERQLASVRPLLVELGLLQEARTRWEWWRLHKSWPRLPVAQSEQRLFEIMRRHVRLAGVRLGRYHSAQSDYFVDLRAAVLEAAEEEVLADALAVVVSQDRQRLLATDPPTIVTKLVGMKEGNPILAARVARKLRLPLALYRGADFPRFHGSTAASDLLDGHVGSDDAVLLIDDSTFRGTTLDAAKNVCQELGARVVGVSLLFRPDNDLAIERLANTPINAAVVISKRVLAGLR